MPKLRLGGEVVLQELKIKVFDGDEEETESSNYEQYQERLKLVLIENPLSDEQCSWLQNLVSSSDPQLLSDIEEGNPMMEVTNSTFLNCDQISGASNALDKLVENLEETLGDKNPSLDLANAIAAKLHFCMFVVRAEAGNVDCMYEAGDYPCPVVSIREMQPRPPRRPGDQGSALP
jgi:hypothetical protein